MKKTQIEWATHTWNIVVGCSQISAGCKHCYAEKMANRLANNPMTKERYGKVVNEDGKWNGVTYFQEDRLSEPSRLKNPSRIFVSSMGDLFHKTVDPEWILKVLTTAEKNPQHTFILLTKRPERALNQFGNWGLLPEHNGMTGSGEHIPGNIWFGVTAENQEEYNRRVPILLQIPTKVRFVSIEPMLGPIKMNEVRHKSDPDIPIYPDWVICGAETGPGKRRMNEAWADNLQDQCRAYDIPFFFKKDSDGFTGGRPREFPE